MGLAYPLKRTDGFGARASAARPAAIGLALAMQPPALLLDERTDTLDPDMQRREIHRVGQGRRDDQLWDARLG